MELKKVDIYVFVNDISTCDGSDICTNVVGWANAVTNELQVIEEGIAYARKYIPGGELEKKVGVNAPYYVLFVDPETDNVLVRLKPDQVNEANIRSALLQLDGGYTNGNGDFETNDGLVIGEDQALQLIPGFGFDLFNFSIPASWFLYASIATGVMGVLAEKKIAKGAYGIASVLLGAMYTKAK